MEVTQKIKAYKAWDEDCCENYQTVVFAKTAKEAKSIASHTEVCGDAKFINIRVHRMPMLDGYYRGEDEIDWNNQKDRKALVDLGWSCEERTAECDTCEAKSVCGLWVE